MSCLRFLSKKRDIFVLFTSKQARDEYKKLKMNMSFLGNNKPKSVYYGYSNDIDDSYIIHGLNSLCYCEIHISITTNPLRLVLSYINTELTGKLTKGDTFHIYNITYKNINNITEITQFDIYNAIQDYYHIYKSIPSNEKMIIAT
jgi:hypothetical protein